MVHLRPIAAVSEVKGVASRGQLEAPTNLTRFQAVMAYLDEYLIAFEYYENILEPDFLARSSHRPTGNYQLQLHRRLILGVL